MLIRGTAAGLIWALLGAAPPSEPESRSQEPESQSDPGSQSEPESQPDERWIHRWAPENNMGELGVYLGVAFPSRRHELFALDASLGDSRFQRLQTAAFDVGLRAGYYPLRFLGIEAEGGVIPTRTADDARATLWTVRGHVVGQLGLWSITPFILAGAGALGVDSGALGNDVDAALHFGAGAKFYLNRWAMLRLDLRDIVSARRGVDEGVAQTFEILLGFSVTLGRSRSDGAKDSDGDGIADWRDRCDDVPGVKPNGCPPDSDGDGIRDDEDKCPQVPETKNRFDDHDGCPDEVPKRIEPFTGIISGINFETNRAAIRPDSRPKLDEVAEHMKSNPDMDAEIVGHTDSTGSRDHNIALSQRRADAVRDYLTQAGVARERLSTRGAGPDEPIGDNTTPEGRAQNRRIEFVIRTGRGRTGE